MDAVVVCHKLEFPKFYSSDADLCESPTHFYGKLKCGKSSGTTVAYVCYKCNKFFTTLKAVQAHGKNHTDTPFSCDKCDKKFLCEKGFQRHTLRHSVFYCEYCDKKFNKVNITEYVVHKDLKHSIKCSLCDKSFVTEGKMLRHCHSMHPESKLPFKCNQCEERFSSQHKLKRHTEEHEIRAERVAAEKQLRKHRCSFCGELCHGVKGLAAHYRTHMVFPDKEGAPSQKEQTRDKTEEGKQKEEEKVENFGGDLKVTFASLTLYKNCKLHVCYVCDKYFIHKRELKNHMKLHADGTTVCPVCELDFSTSDNLLKHKSRVHLYQCKMCNLSFVKKSHRKEHKMYHSEPIDDRDDIMMQ